MSRLMNIPSHVSRDLVAARPREPEALTIIALHDAQSSSLHLEDKLSIDMLPSQVAKSLTATQVDFIESEAQIRQIMLLVSERLQEPDGEWSSEQGACMDFSARWLADLQQRGFAVSFAMTQTAGPQGQRAGPSSGL